MKKHRRPKDICGITAAPVFGLELYAAISKAKIVLNGAVDMAGEDRGNMRCFESMGCGALMVSDAGNYPRGMLDQITMLTYRSIDEAIAKIRLSLEQPTVRADIVQRGLSLLKDTYSKHDQWLAFRRLVSDLS